MKCKLFNLPKHSTSFLSIFVGMMFITSLAHAGVDLVVNHSDSPDPVSAGGVVTYTISVSNNGDTNSPTSTLIVTIPATTSYVSDSSGDGVTCTGPVGSDLTCDFGALAGFPTNEEKSVAVQLLTSSQGIVTVGAVAATSGAGADDTPANNTDDETTTINKGANVALVKTASTLNAPSGSALTYSFAITNNGPDSATLLRIQDPIPAGFSLVSLPSECTNSAGTIICDLDGPIADGDTLNIGPVSGVITAAGSSTLTNAASIGLQPSAPLGTPNDPDTSDNSSTVNTTVTGGSDVKITKSRSVGGSILVGADFNFVLSPSYSGDNPADLTVTDSIPANYTIDVGSFLASQNGWSCGLAGQDVTCTRALGGAGTGYNQAIGDITIPVTVATSGNNVINSTSITTTSTDPVAGNNTATDGGVNLLDPTVNLGIGKTGPTPALVVTGVEFDFYVNVNNTGTTGFYGTATITDNIPANMTVNSYTLNGWGCAPAAPVVGPATITCSRVYTSGSQLAAGATSPSVVMTAETATDGNFTNSATITTPNCNLADCNDGDLDTYQVVSSVNLDSADVRVLKTVDPATVLASDILTYTLEVVNDGPAASANVRLTDTFSSLINNSVGATGAGYIDAVTVNGTATLDSCSDSASGSIGRSLSCIYTSVPVCTASVDCPIVTVRVRPGGNGGARSNTANVVSNGTADPDHSNDSATANNTVTPRADIAVAKAATPSSVAAGQNLTYVVTVSNNGPSRAEGVSLTDTLPHNVTFISATPSAGTCGTKPMDESTTAGGNDSIICAIGSINNGSQQTVTIIVRPNTVTRGTDITNDASAITTTLETDGPANTVNANNSDSVDATILVPSLDLVLNKDDSVDPVAVGNQTVYTITVTNSGPSAAEGVSVTDSLPAAGLSFVSATSSSGTCPTQPAVGDDSGANVVCNIGYLANNSQETVTVTMQGKVKGVYTNSATVTSDETGLGFESAANNSVNELTTVRTKADMEVTSKIASPASVDLRDDFIFTIKIKNKTGAGLSEADNVEVTDTLPADMELTGAPTVGAPTSGSITVSTCTGGAGDTSFTCSLGTVVTNTEVDITVPVQLINVTTMPQTFTNSASVSTSSLDVDLGNNSNTGDVGVNSSSITGTVFRDFNNNGAVTAGDTGISGITITLNGTSFDGAAVSETATTDAGGDFAFTGLPESNGSGYTIVEGAVAETYLNDGTDTAGTGGGNAAAVNDQISAIVLGANTTETGYLFAEVPVARIGIAKRVLSGPTIQADGTFLTTFRLNIENFSLEQINSIVVTDSLNGGAPSFGTYVAGGAGASLSTGEYTIQTAPSGGCGGTNAAFTGSAITTVATVPTLASTASCTLDFAVRARPTAPLPAAQPSGGRYENQTTIAGTGALSAQAPSDTSDNGSNPDPTGNDTAGDAGESDPTPISPSYTPAIGIAKTIQGGITVEANESITVPIRLTIENLGDEPLNTIAITDSMSGGAPKFGAYVAGGAVASLSPGQYTIQAAPSGTCGGLNAAFDGSGTVAVASFASLAIAGSCNIDFTFRFMPLASTTYENQASISAIGDYTTGAVSDTSDSGTNPDPDGDDDPDEAGENDPTPISYPRIGLAKRVVGSSTTNNDGTVTVPFSFVVTNLGGENLNSVVISDDLSGASPQFGSYVAGGSGATLAATEYTINTTPTFSGACTGGTLTPGYNGDGTPSLASITGFASGASCTILTTIRFRPGAPLPAGNNFTNQASVAATGAVSAIDITDLSDDGASPDTDGDGIGNEAGENDPTPVNTVFSRQIALTKTFSVAQSINADGSINAPFRLKVLNSGTEPLITLTVTDNLAGVAPSFGTYVAGGAGATLSRGEYTIQTAPAFNGACTTGTLTAAYTGDAQDQLVSLTRLEVLESCEIDFTMRFLPTSPLPGGGYSNSGSTQGTGEFAGGAAVTDISQNGIDPDPDSNDDPTDNNVPTPVSTIYTPSIGVAKSLQGSLTVNGNDTYTGTFRIIVENLGNEELATVSVSDAMNTAPSNLGTYVAGGAGASLATGQYTIESAPAFNGACTNGTANAAFTGSADAVIATITELDTETSCTIDYDFRFMPQASTSYLNRATTQGTGVYSTSVVTDQSDNGADPDPDGDSDADEAGENDATPVPYPRIGLAKRLVGGSTTNANGTVTVPLSLVVTNLGGEDLTVSAITDDLSGASPQFGSYVAGGSGATLAATEYTIETAPAFFGACTGGTLTPGYEGDATPSVASIANFASGASCTITFTLRFRPGPPLPAGSNFTNQASVAATGNDSSIAVTDLSDDGLSPDTDGDGVGNEAGENDPTPINTTFIKQIALTKTFSAAQSINADGSINAPFRLKVVNSGTEPLITLTVSDDLAGVAPAFGTYVAGGAGATLTRGEYTIQTAPAFNGACATGTLTAAYTGDAQDQLASLTRLEVLDSCEIDFTLRFLPTSPLPGGGYSNSGSTQGTGEFTGGAAVTDISQNGIDPDPDSNDDPTDNNVPTPVTTIYTPSIGVAKSLQGSLTVNGNDTYTGTFRMIVENLGNEVLATVSVSDAMDTAPSNLGTYVAGGAGASLAAGQYSIESAPAFNGACTNGTANAAFNGEGTPVVATITEMAIGASCTVEYNFRFMPQASTSYLNQATTQGTGVYSTTVVTDQSDNGADPDPDGDSDADEAGENDATPVPYPRIGLAKRVVGGSTTNSDGTVTVPFSFVVTNLGGEVLNSVAIADDLAGASPQFGSYVAGGAAATLVATEYTINTAPAFSGACTGGTITPGYNGDGTPSMASITGFASGASCTILTTIRFRPGAPLPGGNNFTNQASVAATGASSAIDITDLSDDGASPDTDGDGVGNEAGENDPTPVNTTFTRQISLTKTFSVAQSINADGTVNASFRLKVLNSGTEPLITLTVTDNLAGVAPSFSTYVAGGAGATLSRGEYTIQTAPAFNGACATGTLTAAYTGDAQDQLASLTRLEVLDSCEIDFTLRFRPTSPLPGGGYSNSGSTQGTGEFAGGAAVTDISQNGTDPDPDSNDDPTDNNVPTPVNPGHTASIGIAKSLQNGLIIDANGSYSGTFSLVVENLGNEELTTVSVNDAMDTAPSNLGTYVAGGAGATLTAGQYTIESAPAFNGACTNGTANAAFNGEATPVVATITELATGTSCTVEYDFRFVPEPGVSYLNQATTVGTGVYSTTVATDQSDNGVDPDTDGDNDADEAGENDATPIPYPRIGLAKRLVGSTTTNADGSVTVPFSFVVTNLGGETLNTVDITDDLSGASPQFGSYVAGGAAATLAATEYTIQTAPAFSGACAGGTIDAAYDGDGNDSIASITSLTSGSSCTIILTMRFRSGAPLPAGGNYTNQAAVVATGASSAIGITDLSDDGTDPDTDNDGVGNEPGENDPTTVNVSFTPKIALTKRIVGSATTNANATVTVPFRVVVSNNGTEPLTILTVSDDLSGVAPAFGTYVAGGAAATLDRGEYTVESAPAFNGACATGTITAAYTGDVQPELASLTRLEVLGSCEIDFILRFKPTSPLPGGGYSNQASTQGTGEFAGGAPVTDLSQDGVDPDPDSDDDATDDNVPTPVNPGHTASIGIAKSLLNGQILNANGSYSGTFSLVVENLGDEELQSVSVSDAMDTAPSNLGTYVAGGAGATLAAGQYTIESAPAFNGACTNGTANAAFTGEGTPVVATITEMAIGASCTVEYDFRFVPEPGVSYLNQATTQGAGAYSTIVATDQSDNGTDPDPSGNGDATEAGENDATPIPYPRIGLAKRLVGSTTTNADGTVLVPLSFVVTNLGGETLNTVGITDDLSGASPQFGTFVAGGAAATLVANQYTIQIAPAFFGACATGTIDPGYDGEATASLASIASLISGSSCTITMTTRFRPGVPLPAGGNFTNQAAVAATGASSAIDITDLSDDGANPDTDGDGVGNEAGENDPTPINVSFTPQVGLTKTKTAAETINANGTVTVPFRLAVSNSGTEPLINVTVSDDLSGVAPVFGTYVVGGAAATLDKGEYTVETAPAFNGACATGTLTAAYTGDAQPQLASLTRLEIAGSCEINFTLRFKPTSPLPGGGYSNQGSTQAIGELSTGVVTDLSQDGADPDPDSNDDPTDNNIPTPVSTSHSSAIGIAKSLQNGQILNTNGSYSGTFRLVVENLGNEELQTVTINDAMNTAPSNLGTFVAGGAAAILTAGQYTIESAPAFVGACTNGTANAAFNGEATPIVATITELATGTSCTVEYDFRFVPQPGSNYFNQATTQGTGAYSTTVVTDQSDNGTDPDTDGDMDADEAGENDPTPIPYPRIGLAKQLVGSTTTNVDGTVLVPLSFVVTNLGGENLSNIGIADDLSGASPQFGTFVAGGAAATLVANQYTIQIAPAFSGACTTGTIDPGYDGEATASLASIASLTSGSSCTITMTTRFRPGAPLPAGGNFTNQAAVAATGASSAIDITDLSDDGANPDTDNDGVGNEAGENDPTPINVSFIPQVGLTKRLTAVETTNANGTITVPFRLQVSNSGTEPLVTITVSDDLSGVAPAFGTYVAGGAAATLDKGEYTIETVPTFNGACATGTLTAGYTGEAQAQLASFTRLEIAASCEINFTLRFKPTSPLPAGGYSNQGSTQATGELSTGVVTDLSQDGVDPDPDSNDDPTDNNDPTPVSPSHNSAIGIAKSLQNGQILNTNGSYSGTFRLVVENFGNEELQTVTINDAMNTAPSNLGTFVAGGAAATLTAGQYTIESAPAFVGACTNGTANAAFNGAATPVAATITELATGTSCTVEYDFRFVPQPGTNYFNQATTQGTGAYSTSVVTDQSDDGTDPDTDGDNDADEAGENDATPIPYPRIGLAKQLVGSTTTNVDGTVTAALSFVVTNLGGETLNTVGITDDLSGASPQFGTFVAGGAAATLVANQYTIQTAPAFLGVCVTGTINPGYDGEGTASLASITSLTSSSSCNITMIIRFRPGAPLPAGGNYLNQAAVAATGASSAIDITDLSDDGADPDTDNDGVGNEAGENDPTPINVSFIPQVGLTKRLTAVETTNANGTITVPFRMQVSNSGTEPLVTITVSDDLAGVAPAFGTYVAGGAAATLDKGEYTIETAPSFNGACTTGTITAGYTGDAQPQLASLTRLEVFDTCEIDFTLRFKPTSPLPAGGYSNQGSTQATGELSTGVVADLSQDGVDPDPDANNDPTDNNDPTPVSPSHNSAIGVAKSLNAGLVVNANGSYNGTFRIVVENLGNEELQTVSVTDAMNTAPSNLGTFIAGGAAATLTAGQYTIESAPAFVGACTNGTANAAYTGTAEPVVATITELDTGTSCTVDFGFRFMPTPGSTYLNQVTAQGTGAYSTTVVTDISDDGTDPDPSANNDATEAGENDPTPIPIPHVGLAKSATAVANNGDGTYDVAFTLTLINAGELALSDIQLSDDLSEFGSYTTDAIPAAGQYTINSDPVQANPANGAALTPVVAGVFTGAAGGEDILVAASSSLPNFGSGSESTAEINFTVRFFPTTPGPFNNSAVTTGTSSSGGNVTDDSVTGNIPDADGNGDPGDDTSPTVVILSGQDIGVAKAVSGIIQTGIKSYTVPYTLIVANLDAVTTLTNVQLTDNLASTFPTAQSMSISTAAAVSACTGTVLNVAAPVFDGITHTKLLAGNQNLQPGEQCTVTFTVAIGFGSNPLPSVVQNNSATGTAAETPGGVQIAADLSDNGNDPDTDDNGYGSDTGESDPTPVNFSSGSLASVSGKVWQDTNHDRIDNDGTADSLPTFIVEVINSAGTILGTTTSDEAGEYSVGTLFPSTAGDTATYYKVRFRESESGAVYGNPLSQDPTNPNGTIVDGYIADLQLMPGTNTVQQDLPLDPSGVVYDSVTRNPVPNATVVITGPGGFDPALHLVGGAGNQTQVTGANGFYQYILLAGAPNGAYTLGVTPPPAYVPTPSTIIPACTNTPTVVAVPSPALVQNSENPPVQGITIHNPASCPATSAGFGASANTTQYYYSFNLTIGISGDVVNNHIPVDPVLGGAITLVKSTPLVNVSVGQLVPYTISATNTLAANLTNIDIRDIMPPGFKYKVGSSSIDGITIVPTINGRVLSWTNLVFSPNGSRSIKLLLVVGSGVQPGEYINQARAYNNLVPEPGNAVSNLATAAVRVIPDPVFDCSDLIGKVFDDQNANGYQDDGEPPLANVRLATVRGLLVTTDVEGRFHVTCAMVPNEFRGSNFIMKLDERTLPSGYRLTTENPRVVRLTRGKMSKLNFGAAIHRVVRLEITDSAFVTKQPDPSPDFAQALDTLPEQLQVSPSVIRLAYNRKDEADDLIKDRLQAVRKRIEKLWEEQGCCYDMTFEEEIFQRNLKTEGGAK